MQKSEEVLVIIYCYNFLELQWNHNESVVFVEKQWREWPFIEVYSDDEVYQDRFASLLSCV